MVAVPNWLLGTRAAVSISHTYLIFTFHQFLYFENTQGPTYIGSNTIGLANCDQFEEILVLFFNKMTKTY